MHPASKNMFRAPLSENASVQVLYRFSALLLSFEIAYVWPNAIPDAEIFKKQINRELER